MSTFTSLKQDRKGLYPQVMQNYGAGQPHKQDQ